MKSILKFSFLLMVTIALLLSACSKDKKTEDNNTEGTSLKCNFDGFLDVKYTNVYPPWDVSTRLDVRLDKDMFTILFETGSLSYSGDTIIGDDSKIERSGSWELEPVGFLKVSGDDILIETDGGVNVVNDIQRIYAKDQNTGNWLLVNETDLSSNPDATLCFSLNEATTGGSKNGISTGTGSISFTLHLLEALN